MAEEYKPNIGGSLLLVHKVITRGLLVTVERSHVFTETGFPAALRDGYAIYVQSLAVFLHAHHRSEDEIGFPYLREILPDAPYDLLTGQHQSMTPLVDQMLAAVRASADSLSDEALRDVHQTATRITTIWQPHIRTEEEYFAAERLEVLISPEEHIRLNELFGRHMQEHAKPDYLVVPFTLYNLPPIERAFMARALPPAVVEDLVPGPWKEKWRPLAPFLLAE